MNRFKLMMTNVNRFKLLCTVIVAAVTVMFAVTGVSYADPVPAAKADASASHQAARDAAAARSKAKRAEAIKKREDTKTYVKKVVEGQDSRPATAPPDNAGKEGAK